MFVGIAGPEKDLAPLLRCVPKRDLELGSGGGVLL